MGLQDLNEDIYRRDYENTREAKTEYDPENIEGHEDGNIPFEQRKWDGKIPKENLFLKVWAFAIRKWRWIMAAVFVAIVIGVAANVAVIREMLFSGDRVSVEIIGPKDVASVESVQYIVKYRNGNVLTANDLELVLSFPDSFRMEKTDGMTLNGNMAVISLPDIEGNASGEAKFSGRFYGSKGSLAYFKASLRFFPTGMSSRFERESQFGVTIASSPVSLEISAPQEVASGNETEYVISYRNESDLSFPNVRVKAEYPEGFRFNQSEPKAIEGDTLWRVGNLLPDSGGEIRVKGVITGTGDQAKVIRVSIGTLQGDDTLLSYDRKERTTRIVASPLVITQRANGQTDLSVNPGDMLDYELRYSNNGDIGLRDVIVTLEINSDLLDLSRLALRGGAYDSVRKVIIWKAPDVPALANLEPKQGGSVGFSVPVRSDIGVSGEAGKHLSILTLAKIDSPDVPFVSASSKVVSSNSLDVRIGSVVDFRVLGYRNDTQIPNTGPFPPKVGQESTYTFHVKATNYLNDLSDAKVMIMLPTAVRYTGKRSPETESFSYNERTGQLVWDIGSLWGGGKSTKELVFQVGITPGPNEVGRAPALILESLFEAKDSFTGKTINLKSSQKTVDVSENEDVAGAEYSVVP